jgi:hypothetical protein
MGQLRLKLCGSNLLYRGGQFVPDSTSGQELVAIAQILLQAVT